MQVLTYCFHISADQNFNLTEVRSYVSDSTESCHSGAFSSRSIPTAESVLAYCSLLFSFYFAVIVDPFLKLLITYGRFMHPRSSYLASSEVLCVRRLFLIDFTHQAIKFK